MHHNSLPPSQPTHLPSPSHGYVPIRTVIALVYIYLVHIYWYHTIFKTYCQMSHNKCKLTLILKNIF